MGRIFGLLFFATLAVFAADLPHFAFLKKPAAVLNRIEQASSHEAVVSKSMINEEAFEHLDPETRKAAIEAAPKMEVHMNPLMRSMMDKKDQETEWPSLPILSWLNRYQNELTQGVAAGAAGLLGVGLLSLLLGQKALGRFCVLTCFSLSRKWLFVLSAAAFFLYATQRVNLWTVMPGLIWMAPVGSILACLAFMRVIDQNYPVWNDTIMSFLSPLTAKLFVRVW